MINDGSQAMDEDDLRQTMSVSIWKYLTAILSFT